MSTSPISLSLDVGSRCLTLRDLTFPEIRLAIARGLILVSFVWPFFNFDFIIPGNSMEVDFLLVFVAALLLPEIMLQDRWSILLGLPIFAVALLWASPTAPLRLAIAIIPLHFLLNLTRTLRARGEEIVPPNLAYRSLQIFVLFCLAQTIQCNYFHIIPSVLSNFLTLIVPRYWSVPYDAFGVRGVQGWASEPSSASLTCIAFALVAIHQRPDRRWCVLGWFIFLLFLNKSIYAAVLTILLLFSCLFTLRRKIYAGLAFIPALALVALYIAFSGRVSDLRTNLIVDGLNSDANHELARFVQILSPLQQFPHLYKPVILFGSWVMEPMGLLPLVAGYGSFVGLIWLAYLLLRNFPLSRLQLRPFALIALLVLLIMAAPDLICSIVALTVFLVPSNTAENSGKTARITAPCCSEAS